MQTRRRASLGGIQQRRASSYDVLLNDIANGKEVVFHDHHETQKETAEQKKHAFDLIRGSPQNVLGVEMKFEEKLGEGAAGIVYKASFRQRTCAAKTLKPGTRSDSQEYKDLLIELDVLATMRSHPNVVQFYGACIENPSYPVILQELMEGPNLEYFLSTLSTGFNLGRPCIYGWTLNILTAIEHLHCSNPTIVHRFVPDLQSVGG